MWDPSLYYACEAFRYSVGDDGQIFTVLYSMVNDGLTAERITEWYNWCVSLGGDAAPTAVPPANTGAITEPTQVGTFE